MANSIDFHYVHIHDNFWSKKLNVWKKTLIRTCLDKCYESGRIDNFKKAAGLMSGEYKGMYFNDSDVYKVLEGAAYFLQLEKDDALEKEIDDIISYIAAAQEEDGYLDTYYTLVEPDKKWTDMEKHEMYCGGHLLEAAVAYYKATGKETFLNVAQKLVRHYLSIFGEGKRNWVEGHEEIELALVKLYRVTNKKEYVDFAKWLLSQRGKKLGKGMIWNRPNWGPAYCQDDVPVENIEQAVGHSVRAMYLYTAMADIYGIDQNEQYLLALKKVWQDMIETKTYITGGIGSSRENEGFKESYFLPNESAYCETCAAIGNVFFNHQMSLITEEASYADVVERCMYNGILSGISLDAHKFFYVNPLASVGDHHRNKWFETSCCPTNLARLLPSIGGYIYAENEQSLIINQYIGNEMKKDGCIVKMQSNFPWEGKSSIEIKQNNKFERVLLRIPAWAKRWVIKVNGDDYKAEVDSSNYLSILLDKQEMVIDLLFESPLRKTYSNPKVKSNRGKIAIEKGPIVYCVEKVDNEHLFYDELTIEHDAAYQVDWNNELACETISMDQDNNIKLIPYYAWDNRKAGYMKVWLDEVSTEKLYHD